MSNLPSEARGIGVGDLRTLVLTVGHRRAQRRPDAPLQRVPQLTRAAVDSGPRIVGGPVQPQSPVSASAPGVVSASLPVGDAIRVVRVGKPAGFTFKPGQHTKLGLPGVGSHSYTIASAPHEPELEFCIERVPGGKVSPGLYRCKAGDKLELGAQAKGSFTLAESTSLHVMVSTVTGIAPFRSMLRAAVHEGRLPQKVVVLQGASYAQELAYRDEFEALAAQHPDQLTYLPTVSRPEAAENHGTTALTGRVDVHAQQLLQGIQKSAGVQVYACGNGGMVKNIKQLCAALGLPFRSETFD